MAQGEWEYLPWTLYTIGILENRKRDKFLWWGLIFFFLFASPTKASHCIWITNWQTMLCDNFGKEFNPGTKQRKLSNNVLIHGTNYGKEVSPGTKQQQMTNNVIRFNQCEFKCQTNLYNNLKIISYPLLC